MPNNKEKTVTLKPYDHAVSDDVFSMLFMSGKDDEERGLKEIPAASYQLVASALELILWDVSGKDRLAIKESIGICKMLRDQQKLREWNRKDS